MIDYNIGLSVITVFVNYTQPKSSTVLIIQCISN